MTALFDNPPVLVEVRFRNCGTSPDWHLCEDEGELVEILSRLSAGAELHLSSVWDLSNRRGPLVVRK
ncbi:MAG TPA: hypothetical protein VML55_08865 [Planctomycetaceae bacterium]|nr:hypothetical protein [Planctomycetaceae bacterium]